VTLPHRILVVDDDPHIRDVICFALEHAGMVTQIGRNGIEALAQAETFRPDLVVLDIGMPELDGLEVCRRLRKVSEVPILFLSARSDEIDRVLGLEIGGDDYVTKPFSPRELVARINIILRRRQPLPSKPDSVLRHGQLTIDVERHAALLGDRDLGLTGLEFAILQAMAGRPRVVFARERLMQAAYDGKVHVSDRTIDSHIRNIRAKSAAAGCNSVIETVHGVGFRLGDCRVPE
jgi:two-component system OmpR family response regulator